MANLERRVKGLEGEAAKRGQDGRRDECRRSGIVSEGWAYRFEDVVRLTQLCEEGRNKEYLSGSVSLAELARRAGVEPYGKPTGEELDDEDYREMLLEEDECEAKGWTFAPVDDDDWDGPWAWLARVDGKFTRVAELRMFDGWEPDRIEEFWRRQRRSRH